MTKEDCIKKLKNCDSNDYEVEHLKADEILLEYINDEEIEEAYNKIHKWYA